ncbi:hypothetical protein ABK040_002142 [Willaertia magna]
MEFQQITGFNLKKRRVDEHESFIKKLLRFKPKYDFNDFLKTIDFQEMIKFIKFNNIYMYIVTTDNHIYVLNTLNDYGFIKLTNNFSNIKLIECGGKFTMLLNDRNEFFISARTPYEFERTNITFNESVKFIRCGGSHFFVVTNDTIYGAGNNENGQLALGFNNSVSKLTNKDIINEIYNSRDSLNIIGTLDGKLLVSGDNSNERLGISAGFCKGKDNNYYIDSFTELQYFKTSKIYVYPIVMKDVVFVVTSDYKINDELSNNESYSMKSKCLQTLHNAKLTDLSIIC